MELRLENDPQVYSLRFDFNALADAEPEVECNLLQAVASWPSLSARQLRGLLYALLKAGHPLVLLKEAGELLTRDMTAVYRGIKLALREAAVLTESEGPAAAVRQVLQDAGFLAAGEDDAAGLLAALVRAGLLPADRAHGTSHDTQAGPLPAGAAPMGDTRTNG